MIEDRAQAIVIAFGLLLVILLVPPALKLVTECHAAGGTVVQGLARLECIQ
jgi:hypothetical protein